MTSFRDLKPDNALWSFQTPRFTIELHALPEDMDPADSFQFDDDIEFARSGDPAAWFCAVMLVRAHLPDTSPNHYGQGGEVIGWDTLGGCSYRSFRDFCGDRCGRAHKRNGLGGDYFPDMVREAIRDARRTLTAQAVRAAKIHA